MNNKVNIYDFDGTIAETNLLKSDAFEFAAIEFGQEIANWFVSYHKANGGITRQVKIKTLCDKLGRVDLYDYFLERYEDYLSKNWLTCPIIPGFREYVKNTEGTNVILSGGAKVEIESYLKFNNLDEYFVEVFGNPIDKDVNLEAIKNKYLSNDVAVDFYGDSKLDFELSKRVQANFYFVKSVSEWEDWLLFKNDFKEIFEDFT